MSCRPDFGARARVAALLLLLALESAAAPVAVTDSRGVTVALPAPAQRIVALAPHLAENLFAAGGGDRLVGTVAWSDYPAAAKDVPRIGGYNSLSLEAIIAREPDLVLAWGSGSSAGLVDRLEGLGLPVYVNEIRSLADIGDSLVALGTLAGSGARGREAAAAFTEALAALGADTGARRLRVFYQIWHDPLQTVGGRHLISAVLDLCGGDNVFGELPALAPRISREAVVARDPQVILASGSGSSRPPSLDDWRRFPALAAVRRDALYPMDPDLLQRPTPRLLAGARRVCSLLSDARGGVCGKLRDPARHAPKDAPPCQTRSR